MSLGICRYCGKEKELCEAHIIPKHFYQVKKYGRYWSVNTKSVDKAHYQNGIKDDKILCSKCDNEEIGIYDKYIYKLFSEKIYEGRTSINDLIFYELNGNNFDYKKVRNFFISLAWRASISNKTEIELGKYEDIALQILKGKINDNENLFFPIIFKKTENYLDSITNIRRMKFSGQFMSMFTFRGYTVGIITNIEPIANTGLIKTLQKDFFNKNIIRIIETDKDIAKIFPNLNSIISKHRK